MPRREGPTAAQVGTGGFVAVEKNERAITAFSDLVEAM
jgi:hypothetical protein